MKAVVAAATGTEQSKESVASVPSQDLIEKKMGKTEKKRRWWPFVVAPYVVGIAWHSVHPIVSIFTGHAGARRWYIDESSLDPSYFRMDEKYSLLTRAEQQQKGQTVSSLCQALEQNKKRDDRSLTCHRQDGLEMARVVPTASAVAPVSEAIVLVVPNSENWFGNQFHYSILQLMDRLSSPQLVPWLAKTILLVSAEYDPVYTPSLHETVDSFLDLYLGSPSNTNHSLTTRINHPAFTGAMIRNLLVVESTTTQEVAATIDDELRILPQGRRGVLPNMDLVFLCTRVYDRSSLSGKMVVHPYRRQAELLWQRIIAPKMIPSNLHRWIRQLLDLLSFEYALAVGPTPPHASALDRGIDALTLQAVWKKPNSGSQRQQQQSLATAGYVSKLEPVLRGLSNLHERLHHSTSLYLLVSPERFVKHEEYLVPNLLLLIPCVIRAVTLILCDKQQRLCLPSVQRALSATLAVTAFCSFVALPLVGVDSSGNGDSSGSWMLSLIGSQTLASQFAVAVAYLPLVALMTSWLNNVFSSPSARQSVQFVACLATIYVHVAIAFGHVSLAFPSAVLWTPLIAFPSYHHHQERGPVARALGWCLFFATCPFVSLVPRIIPTYTPYVRYAYLPLHVLSSIMWLS